MQKYFLGYGASINCAKCQQRVVEQVFVFYSFEQVLFMKAKRLGGRGSCVFDGQIICICTKCNEYSVQIEGKELYDFRSKSLKKDEVESFKSASASKLAAVEARFNMVHTRNWVAKLNFSQRADYFKILDRIGLSTLRSALQS